MYLILCAAPAITHIDSLNGAASGGASISISGMSFGESDLIPSASIALTVCDTSSWSSGTGIVCLQARGSGVGTMSSVVVVTTGLKGTLTDVFTFDCKYAWLYG